MLVGKFIGKPTMGFKTGEIYAVESKIQKIKKGKFPFFEIMDCICIYDMNDKSIWCPYQSLEAVLRNWDFESIKEREI